MTNDNITKAVEELMQLTEYHDYKRHFKPALFGYTQGASYERQITKTLQDLERTVREEERRKIQEDLYHVNTIGEFERYRIKLFSSKEGKGIDWSKDNVYDAVGRPDLKPENQLEEKCKDCSTYRKVANNGARYLCNHFSEPCPDCEEWLTSLNQDTHETKI